MIVCELNNLDRPAWDAYIRSNPAGLPQHLTGWREVLKATYGYETCYLLARQDGAPDAPVIGVLPLFMVRSPLTGHRAMTMPGGLCADNQEVADALIAEGIKFAGSAQARQFVILDSRRDWSGKRSAAAEQRKDKEKEPVDRRTGMEHYANRPNPISDIQVSQNQTAWIVDVRGGREAVEQRLDRNIRRQVRMAQRNGLTVEIANAAHLLAPFYAIWGRFTHQVGTPVFGRTFLEHVIATFPDAYNIAIVTYQGQAIGGYFQLQMGQTIYGVWGATLHAFLELRPVYLAYWEMLQFAANRGAEYLDMGRSPSGSNRSSFKAQWGGEAVPIYRHVYQLAGEGNHSSTESRYQVVSQVWRRLPFPVAQFLGPKLRRHLPFA